MRREQLYSVLVALLCATDKRSAAQRDPAPTEQGDAVTPMDGDRVAEENMLDRYMNKLEEAQKETGVTLPENLNDMSAVEAESLMSALGGEAELCTASLADVFPEAFEIHQTYLERKELTGGIFNPLEPGPGSESSGDFFCCINQATVDSVISPPGCPVPIKHCCGVSVHENRCDFAHLAEAPTKEEWAATFTCFDWFQGETPPPRPTTTTALSTTSTAAASTKAPAVATTAAAGGAGSPSTVKVKDTLEALMGALEADVVPSETTVSSGAASTLTSGMWPGGFTLPGWTTGADAEAVSSTTGPDTTVADGAGRPARPKPPGMTKVTEASGSNPEITGESGAATKPLEQMKTTPGTGPDSTATASPATATASDMMPSATGTVTTPAEEPLESATTAVIDPDAQATPTGSSGSPLMTTETAGKPSKKQPEGASAATDSTAPAGMGPKASSAAGEAAMPGLTTKVGSEQTMGPDGSASTGSAADEATRTGTESATAAGTAEQGEMTKETDGSAPTETTVSEATAASEVTGSSGASGASEGSTALADDSSASTMAEGQTVPGAVSASADNTSAASPSSGGRESMGSSESTGPPQPSSSGESGSTLTGATSMSPIGLTASNDSSSSEPEGSSGVPGSSDSSGAAENSTARSGSTQTGATVSGEAGDGQLASNSSEPPGSSATSSAESDSSTSDDAAAPATAGSSNPDVAMTKPAGATVTSEDLEGTGAPLPTGGAPYPGPTGTASGGTSVGASGSSAASGLSGTDKVTQTEGGEGTAGGEQTKASTGSGGRGTGSEQRGGSSTVRPKLTSKTAGEAAMTPGQSAATDPPSGGDSGGVGDSQTGQGEATTGDEQTATKAATAPLGENGNSDAEAPVQTEAPEQGAGGGREDEATTAAAGAGGEDGEAVPNGATDQIDKDIEGEVPKKPVTVKPAPVPGDDGKDPSEGKDKTDPNGGEGDGKDPGDGGGAGDSLVDEGPAGPRNGTERLSFVYKHGFPLWAVIPTVMGVMATLVVGAALASAFLKNNAVRPDDLYKPDGSYAYGILPV